ncbi:FeoA family protein [Zymomonas mobilis subsp. mobilis ZM4 = ATCC 31821]|uniref:FeoA family protein n=2 Tax=Zymomonas mobilis subsp. mobilis TaxID=120045 RepID=Q5NM96_ZYMMO|nr:MULTISPECIES: FeoA family protein [Zymomonas]AAV90164.1 FeoA family protein [Zymomonas mobilis subsp. mobilis ZM4 = ATCC 31821]ACV76201.1 FeoA family protein [Zymomonas mobilis subsp. mobilis NCIMB 11163]AEH63404.1 FeoA family protein [Zymomonas mobilis subsp. mobilis ATCC 10988]AHB10887.1 Fe2+ transport system protein A [Zymomonas mobilis subsp. mobilis str. CP4 = NRRL B-14023]AHJ71198.1 FeoA domain protein [Zymomonas mobilis subsp. mobilis NRRL B-12526]
MRLNEMPLKKATVITDIDWSALPPEIGRRLRDLGFHKGAEVELQHFAPISRDPIACRVDRILIAIRQQEASVISVKDPDAAPEPALSEKASSSRSTVGQA